MPYPRVPRLFLAILTLVSLLLVAAACGETRGGGGDVVAAGEDVVRPGVTTPMVTAPAPPWRAESGIPEGRIPAHPPVAKPQVDEGPAQVRGTVGAGVSGAGGAGFVRGNIGWHVTTRTVE